MTTLNWTQTDDSPSFKQWRANGEQYRYHAFTLHADGKRWGVGAWRRDARAGGLPVDRFEADTVYEATLWAVCYELVGVEKYPGVAPEHVPPRYVRAEQILAKTMDQPYRAEVSF